MAGEERNVVYMWRVVLGVVAIVIASATRIRSFDRFLGFRFYEFIQIVVNLVILAGALSFNVDKWRKRYHLDDADDTRLISIV